VFLSIGTTYSIVVTAVTGIYLITYLALCASYGCGDMSRFKTRGKKYRVGVREFRFKSRETKCLIFYPIDEEEYQAKIGTKKANYYRFEDKEAYCKSRSKAMGKGCNPSFLWKPFTTF
jgi:hypothetical protein